jgi:hypothetical protein
MEPFLREVPQRTSSALALAAIVAPAGARSDALAADLVAAGGRLRTGPAGRPVALFDGPATAVRAGLARLRQPARLGLAVAEVPRDDPHVEAHGVEVVITLGDIAPPGSLWVSSTARDLLAGSGVVLEPVGTHRVGVVGSQPVFRAITVG